MATQLQKQPKPSLPPLHRLAELPSVRAVLKQVWGGTPGGPRAAFGVWGAAGPDQWPKSAALGRRETSLESGGMAGAGAGRDGRDGARSSRQRAIQGQGAESATGQEGKAILGPEAPAGGEAGPG